VTLIVIIETSRSLAEHLVLQYCSCGKFSLYVDYFSRSRLKFITPKINKLIISFFPPLALVYHIVSPPRAPPARMPDMTPTPSLLGRKCLALDLDETLVHSSFEVKSLINIFKPNENNHFLLSF
jgi:hypothetical protein